MWGDIATVVITGVFALGGVYLGHRLGMEGTVRLRDRDVRLRAYAALMGLRRVVTQLYFSRFEAYIFSDFHEAAWRLSGYPKDSIDLREEERWRHRSEDSALEAARADQQLFETVGEVLTTFPSSQKLTKLADAVYHHKTPLPPVGGDKINSAAKLIEWKSEQVRVLQNAVPQVLEVPIEALIGHLAQCIQADKQPWWSRLRAGNARRIAGQ